MGSTVYLSLDIWDDPNATAQIRTWVDERGETLIDMDRHQEGDRLHFTGTITLDTPELLWYYFKIKAGDGGTCYYGTLNNATTGEGILYGHEPSSWQVTVYLTRQVRPKWWLNGIVYQIFPDRFNRGKDWKARVQKGLVEDCKDRKGPGHYLVEDWNQPVRYQKDGDGRVTSWDFYGGTLEGITEKLDYLAALGITVLYINPIFEASSNHRYDTANFMKIDPLLGDDESFERLCSEAAKHGISIMLDGVFNHTGCDSVYFNKYGNYPDVGAYQSADSPYRSWYQFDENGNYASWWGNGDLPDVNEKDPGYHELICGKDGVVRHWMRLGARGWRLDVADELPESFIQDIYSAARAEKSDACVIGEVWEDASNKISYGYQRHYLLGNELDSTMNYPFRGAVLDFLLNKVGAPETVQRFEQLFENYPHDAFYGALNLLGSHDRSRVLTLLGGAPNPDSMDDNAKFNFRLSDGQLSLAKSRLWAAALMQMTMPGVPSVYYGDEAGCQGYTDPYNRGTFPWDRIDRDCFNIYRNAIGLRKTLPVLTNGDFKPFAINDNVFGYTRYNDDCCVMVLVNASLSERADFTVDMRYDLVDDVVSGKNIEVKDGKVQVGMWPLGTVVLYFRKASTLAKPLEPGAGVLCHITSLPNKAGHQGTLGKNARRFVDYLADTGVRYWQVLPVSPCDQYGSSYAGLSAFAGNTALVEGGEKELKKQAERISCLDPGFRDFCKREEVWLTPYALFRAIKHLCRELPWQKWPKKWRTYDPELEHDPKLKAEVAKHRKRQYIFSREWGDLHRYANSKGISIIGDMPMYVSLDSSDVWSHPEYFMLDEDGYAAEISGCPPDQFSQEGQVWGNPCYNWQKLKEDNYAWWLNRLHHASRLYDYVRLDHFLGFSSYYTIAEGKSATEGQWKYGPGADLFIRYCKKYGPLSAIAEDLGNITPAVRALLARTGFAGIDVIQFSDEDVRQGYTPAHHKISYTGTHDTQTLRGWVTTCFPDADADELTAQLTERVLKSDAPVAIMPLQDVLGLGDDARMNVPGVAEGNWAWQATWEQIDGAKEHLTELIEASGRSTHKREGAPSDEQ